MVIFHSYVSLPEGNIAYISCSIGCFMLTDKIKRLLMVHNIYYTLLYAKRNQQTGRHISTVLKDLSNGKKKHESYTFANLQVVDHIRLGLTLTFPTKIKLDRPKSPWVLKRPRDCPDQCRNASPARSEPHWPTTNTIVGLLWWYPLVN